MIAYLVQCLGQESCATSVCNVPIPWVRLEVLFFGSKGICHSLVLLYVCLAAVDNTNKAELEQVDATSQDVERVCALVHQVELGEYTNRATALRIDRASKLERFRVGEIDIGG